MTGDERVASAGIGLPPEIVVDSGSKRFRDVADEAGLLGHRLAWGMRGLKTVITASGRMGEDVDKNLKQNDEVKRYGHRAMAFRRDLRRWKRDDDSAIFLDTAIEVMIFLTSTVVTRHGRPPAIDAIMNGDRTVGLKAAELEAKAADALHGVAKLRRKRAIKSTN